MLSMPQKISLGRYFILLKERSLQMVDLKLVKVKFAGNMVK